MDLQLQSPVKKSVRYSKRLAIEIIILLHFRGMNDVNVLRESSR